MVFTTTRAVKSEFFWFWLVGFCLMLTTVVDISSSSSSTWRTGAAPHASSSADIPEQVGPVVREPASSGRRYDDLDRLFT